ncbi:Uncharacterised protein [Streptococcus pneumoniae]|nr:Uncharacterised protein [Streptococcus pneumoniae]
MSTYKSFDTEDNEAVSLASIGDVIKVTVIDKEGYYQSTYMTHETAKQVRDHLTQLIERREGR